MKSKSVEPYIFVLLGFTTSALVGWDLDGWTGAKVVTGIYIVVMVVGFALIDYAKGNRRR
jgi:hypothetical protein